MTPFSVLKDEMKLIDKFEIVKNKIARNRIIMAPMDTLMADEGYASDFHIQHYGSRSFGGVGTIIVESTAVSPEGMIRKRDLGIWKDEHIENLTRLSKIIKDGGAIAGIQLNHAGGKSEVVESQRLSTTMYFDYIDQAGMKLANESDLLRIEDDFVKAAHRAKMAGFDFIELHAAHGYLMNQMLNPQLNDVIKSDDILIRAKHILSIIKRIAEEVKIPIGIRLSVTDHVEGGMVTQDYKPFIEAIEKYISYINVSSGETLERVRTDELIKKAGTKLFRIPLAKEVKSWTKVNVICAGNILNREDAESLFNEGIDGAIIGRELLFNPNLVLNTFLEPDEMPKCDYHWNDNIWFCPEDYLRLQKSLKLK